MPVVIFVVWLVQSMAQFTGVPGFPVPLVSSKIVFFSLHTCALRLLLASHCVMMPRFPYGHCSAAHTRTTLLRAKRGYVSRGHVVSKTTQKNAARGCCNW